MTDTATNDPTTDLVRLNIVKSCTWHGVNQSRVITDPTSPTTHTTPCRTRSHHCIARSCCTIAPPWPVATPTEQKPVLFPLSQTAIPGRSGRSVIPSFRHSLADCVCTMIGRG
jgi:hypothetical protein